MGKLLQDIRYGMRVLARSPGFTAVAILTLALGIGANTAIFTLIDAVMLRALPVEKPSQLVLLKWSARQSPRINMYMSAGDCASNLEFGAANPSGCEYSEPLYREMARSNAFSGVVAFANAGRLDVTGNGAPTVIGGQIVSGNFFRTLGVKAAAGRVFDGSDDSPSAAPVAVLNYGYWQSAYGGSRDVIGRTIELDSVPFTIVGVAEQRFDGLTPGSDYDVWLPLADAQRINDPVRWRNRQDDVTQWWLTLVARLNPQTTISQAQAAASAIFRNQMLHGSFAMFQAGGVPGGHGPAPGAGPGRQMMTFGGPPPAGPGPARSPAPGGPGVGPMAFRPEPAPNGGGPAAKAQPGLRTPGQGAAPGPNAAFGRAPAAPPAEQTTLSKPDDNPSITLEPAQNGLTGYRTRYANPLYVLMVAVGIILLIACANVAGLMLARSAARRKEMAVRLALGAGGKRIVRQLLTESVMLSALGGVLGIAFAYWSAHTIVSFVSRNQPRPMAVESVIDWRVLVFTLGVSVLTGVFFGIAPAFRSVRVDLTPELKEGEGASSSGAHAGRSWLSAGNLLVVSQVALAVVVLVGAGLVVRTLRNLRSVDAGFDSHNLVIFDLDASHAGYQDAQIASLYRDLQGRLAETPGVKSASYSEMPLLSGNLLRTMFHWPGTPEDRMSEANMLSVGPDFFGTMHIPLLEGRGFNTTDYALVANASPASPPTAAVSVIVNQAFVGKYVGKDNPLGKQFGESSANQFGPANPGWVIVGVVRDAKYSDLRQDIFPTMYVPQSGFGFGTVTYELRTAADPQALLPAIRKAVAQLNPNLPLFDIRTESEQIDRLLFQERLVARLSTFFGVLALLLACIGLYGMLSYEVARRTREIGIRMALGAQVGDILRLVVKQGAGLALAGALVGLGVALGVTRYLTSMLYDVRANDPLTLVAVGVLLGAVVLAACYIPARRAALVDPVIALRHE
jgi:predicted permease